MENDVAEVDVLGGFEGSLDLVHGVDAAGFLRMDEVDGGRAGAAHLAVGVERGMERPGRDLTGGEPCGDFVDMLAAGVVEVLPRGEDFDRLRAAAGSELKETRVEALLEKQVGREAWQHGFRVSAPVREASALILLALLSHRWWCILKNGV